MRIGAVNVFEDNEEVIKLAVNKHASRRTKHIAVKHPLVRDACNAGKVRVVSIRTEDQHAYLFTKPLDTQKFHKRAKTDLNVVRYESNIGVYCEYCELYRSKDRFLYSKKGLRE